MEALKVSSDRILVIQTAYLGDAILTLPMLKKLKDRNPEAQIDVLAIPSTKEIFSSAPYVDDVIIIDKKGNQKGIRALNRFIKELRKNTYTALYSPHRSFRSAYITYELGCNESYGFDNSNLKYAYKHLVEYKVEHHEVQRNLALIGENIEGESWKIPPEISIDEVTERNVNTFITHNQLEDGFISIAPGSVWNTKRYPKEKYIELIKLLIDKNETILVIGSEDDSDLCSEITSQFTNNLINIAGRFRVIETICLLRNSKLLITNDSAPTHMGMCVDIPVLTIYCSTIKKFGFHPYNKKSQTVSFDELDCKPCGIHGYSECPLGTFDCGNNLMPETILLIAQKMLSTNE